MKFNKYNNSYNIIGSNIKNYRIYNHYTQNELFEKLTIYGLNLYHSNIYLIEQ